LVSFLLKPVIFQRFEYFRGVRKHHRSIDQIVTLYHGLQGRSTSVAADGPLCLGTMLGLDVDKALECQLLHQCRLLFTCQRIYSAAPAELGLQSTDQPASAHVPLIASAPVCLRKFTDACPLKVFSCLFIAEYLRDVVRATFSPYPSFPEWCFSFHIFSI
jgi:hypothetical protein